MERGHDSNAVRAALGDQGLEPILPARDNNTVATHPDGRKLRRDKRRWLIARTHAWPQTVRRLVVRYAYSAVNGLALVQIACAPGDPQTGGGMTTRERIAS